MEALSIPFSSHISKSYIDDKYNNEPKRDFLFIDFIQSMIDKPYRTESYKQSYLGVINYLRDFSIQNKCELYTNSITEEFLEDFIYWLRNKDLRPNTIQGIISKVKSQVRKAGNYGYAVNRTFDDILPKGEISPSIALSMSDITRLYYFKGLTKSQENIRDLFIIGCMTGLRFSDYSTLTLDNVINNVIVKKTKKTGITVYVPIHKYVREIISKYNGFPKTKNIQHFNRYIKEICKKAGFDTDYIFNREKGLVNIIEKYKMYELISSHTARRSFATNMYNSGRFSTAQIMQITGHTSEKSFLKYIKIDKNLSANSISTDLYFNQ